MPRKSRSKQPNSPASEPVAVAERLGGVAEKHNMRPAADLPRQLPAPELELEPLPKPVAPPEAPGTHAEAVRSGRRRFAPVPAGFINVVSYPEAGVRVNKSLDKRVAALQFAEDRPLSRAHEYDLMTRVQDAGFQFNGASRQWPRQVPEGMYPGENIIEAGRIAREIAEARGQGRGR